MRSLLGLLGLVAGMSASAQAPGKFPPDSLVNVLVIPKTTPVINVVGQMRNITSALGVRCVYCHVGSDSLPIERTDFVSDEKRTKLTARHMMRMVQEINRRVDSIPGRPQPPVVVTCMTCHRGVARPMPLEQLVAEAAVTTNADSAVRAYDALRRRYFGGAAYDFREPTLNIAAFRAARQGKIDDALTLIAYNETLFPNASSSAVFRGNILLMRADTNGAAAAFREAIRRDTTNAEARGRLRAINRNDE